MSRYVHPCGELEPLPPGNGSINGLGHVLKQEKNKLDG